MEKSDKNLVEEYLDGDESAFSGLLNKHLKPVYNFVYRFVNEAQTANDLVQETFLKAWKNIKRFDTGKNFKTWIFTIAKNTTYDYLRKKKTIPFSNFIDEEGNNKLENISEDEILSDEILNRKNIAQEMEKKLNEIPEKYRIILTMHYKEDFSLQEIAQILGEPYNTIKSRHIRGLKKLKELII